MQKKSFLVILAGALFPLATYADNNAENQCARLHIQIGNGSKTACQLINKNVMHGKLVSSPPAMIMPGHTERFDISQTYRGPEIKLEYNCGGKTISFISQQNYCFLKAGQVSGKITRADFNITAHFTTENGSYYWSKPGLINWVLLVN